ncbi:autotransporter outer membrane beta-barrel domain-containing protein [Cognatishimia activa]|uniref:Autotransporter outer membrane beta-barrel domain-containing protein n=1 Tax=Cognatishimia activa TaxID=1715691 RepID=A0A975EPQ6_9RHOB|nr:autotransporter outer membrane beta-barrel domain-containing protein [Cognatishimia activa]
MINFFANAAARRVMVCVSMLLGTVLTGTTAQAQAAPLSCTAVTNVNLRLTTPLSITVETGDLVTINPPTDPFDSAGTVGVSFYGAASQSVNVPNSFAAIQNGTIIISQEAGGASISCQRPASSLDGIRAIFFMRSQAQQIQRSLLWSLRSRRANQSGVSVSQNHLFVSTHGLDVSRSELAAPEFNAWFDIQGRRFTGTGDGSDASFTFGVDRDMGGDTLIGGYFSFGRMELSNGTGQTTTRSPAIGAYVSTPLSDGVMLDANLGFGRPRYDVNGDQFTASRVFGGLTISGDVPRGAAVWSPFFTLTASREVQPSYTSGATTIARNVATSAVGSLGLRVDAAAPMANGFLPYASLAADFGRSTSTAAGGEDFVAPRVAVGFTTDLGNGQLGFDLDAGKVGSGTRDVGVSLRYEMTF